jgi:hypothetical protein
MQVVNMTKKHFLAWRALFEKSNHITEQVITLVTERVLSAYDGASVTTV